MFPWDQHLWSANPHHTGRRLTTWTPLLWRGQNTLGLCQKAKARLPRVWKERGNTWNWCNSYLGTRENIPLWPASVLNSRRWHHDALHNCPPKVDESFTKQGRLPASRPRCHDQLWGWESCTFEENFYDDDGNVTRKGRKVQRGLKTKSNSVRNMLSPWNETTRSKVHGRGSLSTCSSTCTTLWVLTNKCWGVKHSTLQTNNH